ncbi:fasciclin domain-containing protein [Paracoccus chinensis]|uniref:Uncaracterized surface protein containing fasciclin (FAS1) repeats n=1 Tax=Paracoccus chinensis TaxID=525640 RepID=A0A1G9DQE7_9RHOB|nr:fasciclin domain-containing protein [Paracoccus chinensis]SDK66060.1 Uncaracterized surface protein containing fasciclin (FAS1) repeats [Paracoccus chinensis]
MSLARTFTAAALFAVSAGAALAQDAPATVVDVAVGSPDHTTLVQAVTAAGLAETLQGAGPFTVFAPTNAAFAALPAGALDDLLKPENKEQLVGVLGCHVVEAKAMAADVTKMIADGNGSAEITTLGNCRLTVTSMDGKVMIGGAGGTPVTVTATDLEAGNGVVHVIDGVLLPAS